MRDTGKIMHGKLILGNEYMRVLIGMNTFASKQGGTTWRSFPTNFWQEQAEARRGFG